MPGCCWSKSCVELLSQINRLRNIIGAGEDQQLFENRLDRPKAIDRPRIFDIED
jgi:hypothetical protein